MRSAALAEWRQMTGQGSKLTAPPLPIGNARQASLNDYPLVFQYLITPGRGLPIWLPFGDIWPVDIGHRTGGIRITDCVKTVFVIWHKTC